MARAMLWKICLTAPLLAGSAWGRGGWADPPGGWDYVYEADAGQAAFVELTTGDIVNGLLDGSWHGGSRGYFWDGSAYGQHDLADPAGFAPGGAALAEYVALGEGGSKATTLSVEVAGDTTTAAGNPFNFAWNSPANQAIYFYRGTLIPGGTTTATVKGGMTVIARWRLKPTPKDVETPVGRAWRGQGFVADGNAMNGAGMISVVDQDDINCSLSITDEGKLRLMDQIDLPLPGGNPVTFLATWMTVKLIAADTWRIEVFTNGSSTAAYAQDVFDPPDGDEAGGNPDDYIAFGLPVVGTPGAMELDYIGYKIGFFRPGDAALPPANLGCALDEAPDPDSLTMTWTIPAGAVYDSLEIVRNGTTVATLPGTDTTWTTTALERGDWTYGIRAVVGGTPLLPTH